MRSGKQANPPWTADELILALDLFFRVSPLHASKTHPEVIALSGLLNKLPIHPNRPDAERFRNPNGVYMKLCNFLRLDPSYGGAGLGSGSHGDEVVWNEYANNVPRLQTVAKAIRSVAESPDSAAMLLRTIEEDGSEEASEGMILTRLHSVRERDTRLVKRKKAAALKKHGTLRCEVCDFEFERQFHRLGEGFIECHHIRPLSTLARRQKTRMADLALVCANCHRILHRGTHRPTIEQLRATIGKPSPKRLTDFEEYLDRYLQKEPSILTSRLHRGGVDQVEFLRVCSDREASERFVIAMSRFEIWSRTLAERIASIRPDSAPSDGPEMKILRSVCDSLYAFAEIQNRLSFEDG